MEARTLKKRGFILGIILATASAVFGEPQISISGAVEWDTLEIRAAVSLDLASAGLGLPAGRTLAESLVAGEYLRLIRPGILDLPVDSSSTIADLVERGEISMLDAENFARQARSVPPALSADLRSMSASYTLNLDSIGAALVRHKRPAPGMRTLLPAQAADYTGLVIIASDLLPVHGMKGSALAVPCLFPKIWDSGMNLVFERNMLETGVSPMVRYAPSQSIFGAGPSGITGELAALVGERPLRIFARGLFGVNPTDIIIDREDALLIISSEANRRLLAQGRVALIVDDSVLKTPLGTGQ
jgi:hypothetical protein